MGTSMSLDEPNIKSSGLKIKIRPPAAQASTPAPVALPWGRGGCPNQAVKMDSVVEPSGVKGCRLLPLFMMTGHRRFADQARTVSMLEYRERDLTWIGNIWTDRR